MALQVEGNRLKDGGNYITLQGVNYYHWDRSNDGAWAASGEPIAPYDTPYRSQAVIDNLDMMKAWGCNTVRHVTTVENWKDAGFLKNIKDTIGLMQERDMYTIIVIRSVQNWPYNIMYPVPYGEWIPEDIRYLMPDRASFVALWQFISTELSSFDNVILETVNEPHDCYEEYVAMVQEVVDSVPQIVNVSYGYRVLADLYHRTTDGVGYIYDVTGNNTIYSVHFYPISLKYNYVDIANPTYEDILDYFELSGLNQAFKDKPVFAGEINCSLASYFYRLAELGIGFLGWAWTNISEWALLSEGDVFLSNPSSAGEAIINAFEMANSMKYRVMLDISFDNEIDANVVCDAVTSVRNRVVDVTPVESSIGSLHQCYHDEGKLCVTIKDL